MSIPFSVLNIFKCNKVKLVILRTNLHRKSRLLRATGKDMVCNDFIRSSFSTFPGVNNDISTDLIPNVRLEDMGITKKTAFDVCEEDVSDHVPALRPSFNFAAYVNDSPTLQKFVELGVSLYKFEVDTKLCNYILSLDFKRDMEQHLMFLQSVGVPEDKLGNFLTKNPLIFKEELENLCIRINYLESKHFKPNMISHIITANPLWLSHTTQDIDSRLGFFQQTFDLMGSEVRLITFKKPKLITSDTGNVTKAVFTFKEEMGFSQEELKTLVTSCPTLFMMSPWKTKRSFEFLDQEMSIPHETILQQPQILTCRIKRIKARHLFLKLLNKDQYDPKKENYVSPLALVTGTDIDFCENIAKTSIESYNTFLKSL